MHTAIVDIAIQRTRLKPSQATFTLSCHSMTCSRYGFHTDRSCSDLRSGYLVNPLAFPAYVFTGYPFFGRETRPFLFSKNCLIGGACNTHLHHSILKEQRNFCGVYGTRTRDLRRDRAALLTN